MAQPNVPFLRTDGCTIGPKEVFARIPPDVFTDIPLSVRQDFIRAVNGTRAILGATSRGQSGIKALTGGGWEIKINSGQRVFTNSKTALEENGCIVLVFDRYQSKHS